MLRLNPFRRAGRRRKTRNTDLLARPLAGEPLEDRRLLTTFVVNNEADVVDLNPALLSLREAVGAANSNLGADTIQFAPAIRHINLTLGQIEVTDSVTIDGNVSIDAQGNSRIFDVDDGDHTSSSSVTLSRLKMTGGASLTGGAILSHESRHCTTCKSPIAMAHSAAKRPPAVPAMDQWAWTLSGPNR